MWKGPDQSGRLRQSTRISHIRTERNDLSKLKIAQYQLSPTMHSGAFPEIIRHLGEEGATKAAKERAAQLQSKKENPIDSASCQGNFGRGSRHFPMSSISECTALCS